jgi:hypothetical protein
MSAPIREKREIITDTDPATGTVTREAWYKDGKLDRADGPAFILRDPTGSRVILELWWKDGKRIEPPSPAANSAPAPG